MKNSIPSDLWERKKALIAKLYKEEEWPLKQVIKKIRSDDFNPSETQLRSRLKKWRVTKPSRQTRKKIHDAQEGAGSDQRQEQMRSNDPGLISPKSQVNHRGHSDTVDLSGNNPDWYGMYTQPEEMPATSSFSAPNPSQGWAQAMALQSSVSPSKRNCNPSNSSSPAALIPSSGSYNPPHTSPLVDDALVSSTSTVAPSFQDSPYTVTTDSCLPTPVSTTGAPPPIQWAMPQWYSVPLEAAATHASSMSLCPSAPLSPPVDPAMHLMSHQAPHRVYTPHSPQSSTFSHPQICSFSEGTKPWKRTISDPYIPDAAGSDPRVDQHGQMQDPMGRKVSLPTKMTSHHPGGLVTPPSPYVRDGQHPIMCAPMYLYAGADPLGHRPPSIDF